VLKAIPVPTLGLLQTIMREATTRERAARVPEPDLVMNDPKQVADYIRAGREAGIMSPTYIFHCAHMCEVVIPGDSVLDLACGPATQLGMLARLNPDARFVGIDLSEEMLDRARRHIAELTLDNVEVRPGDITALDGIGDGTVDAVVSTMSLHHLPSFEQLDATFAEARRVLKPGGGVYLADFGHLNSERSIRYFAYQHEEQQPELFTLDYLNSLRAAFDFDDFRNLVDRHFPEGIQLFSTFVCPFMVAIKSDRRNMDTCGARKALRTISETLAAPQQRDLKDLITFFRLGGLHTPLLAR
jgi:arsenite methyltransferase